MVFFSGRMIRVTGTVVNVGQSQSPLHVLLHPTPGQTTHTPNQVEGERAAYLPSSLLEPSFGPLQLRCWQFSIVTSHADELLGCVLLKVVQKGSEGKIEWKVFTFHLHHHVKP